MPGPTIQWKTVDTGAPASPIVSNGRFRLASPGAVLGSPSLAMQSAAQLAVVNVYSDDSGRIEAVLTVAGTTLTPIVNSAGKPFTAQQLFGLSIEVTGITNGEVLYTTDEPNGSPSSPFTTVDQRTAWATANLATLYPGRSTVRGPGDSTEWVWNGPLATDWEGIRGPFLGSPSNPFASVAELNAAYPNPRGVVVYVKNRCVGNPVVGEVYDATNVSRLVGTAPGVWAPPAGEPLIRIWGISGNPIEPLIVPGVTTVVQAWQSPVLPDYMFPDGQAAKLSINGELYDPGVPSYSASLIGAYFSGSASSTASDYDYAISQKAGAATNIVRLSQFARDIVRSGSAIRYSDGRDSQILNSGIAALKEATMSSFIAGQMRVRVNVQTAIPTTGLRLWGVLMVAQ